MAVIQVHIQGGDGRQVEAGLSVAEALKQLGVAGDHDVVAAKVNGQLVDLSAPLQARQRHCAHIPGIPRGVGHRPPQRRPYHG